VFAASLLFASHRFFSSSKNDDDDARQGEEGLMVLAGQAGCTLLIATADSSPYRSVSEIGTVLDTFYPISSSVEGFS